MKPIDVTILNLLALRTFAFGSASQKRDCKFSSIVYLSRIELIDVPCMKSLQLDIDSIRVTEKGYSLLIEQSPGSYSVQALPICCVDDAPALLRNQAD